MKYEVGWAPGTFDLFHVGHLNILKRAKEMCEYLICTVSTDEQVIKYKNKSPVIPFAERIEIVRAIKYVDEAVPQLNQDKFSHWQQYQFNVIFVGDDLKNTPQWLTYEEQLKPHGVDFIYFSYTVTTSSTIIKNVLMEREISNG